MNFLEDLYCGCIQLDGMGLEGNKEYWKASTDLVDKEKLLEDVLDEDKQPLLDDISEAQFTFNAITAEKSFVAGFKVGARIMVEVLGEDVETCRKN